MNRVKNTQLGLISTLRNQEEIIKEIRHLALRLNKQRNLIAYYNKTTTNNVFDLSAQDFDKLISDRDSATLHAIELNEELQAQKRALYAIMNRHFGRNEKEQAIETLIDLLIKEIEK